VTASARWRRWRRRRRAATTFTVDSTQYLKVGQIIDVRTKTTGTLENAGNVSLTISAINRTTKVVTVSANVTATTTTAGVYIAGSYGLELEGLRRIGATGRTLYGINSSTAGNEYWDPQVKARRVRRPGRICSSSSATSRPVPAVLTPSASSTCG
jgi:hypothetical protein